MKTRTLSILIALAAASAGAADEPADVGVAAVEALGRINGQALACSEQAVAARAKELMLKYAPRTPRYGSAFEQSTQRGFMDQVKGRSACPAESQLVQRLDVVAIELGKKLPVTE